MPPKALGGHDLVPTCRACNSRAGSKFDAEAHRQERLWHQVGPVTARVEMHAMGSAGMLLIGVPQINNPAELDQTAQRLRALSRTGSTDCRFTVTPQLR